jgi:uncharacterized membrane protein
LKVKTETTMPLLEKTEKKRRTRRYRRRIRVLWITAIVLGSIMILGAILLASMDDYSWLGENGPSDHIHP